MIAALALGTARSVTEPGLLARMTALLARLGLPVDVNTGLPRRCSTASESTRSACRAPVRFVLVPHPGQAVIEEISLEEIKRQLLLRCRSELASCFTQSAQRTERSEGEERFGLAMPISAAAL